MNDDILDAPEIVERTTRRLRGFDCRPTPDVAALAICRLSNGSPNSFLANDSETESALEEPDENGRFVCRKPHAAYL